MSRKESMSLKPGQVWRSGTVHARIINTNGRKISFDRRNGRVGRYTEKTWIMPAREFFKTFNHFVSA